MMFSPCSGEPVSFNPDVVYSDLSIHLSSDVLFLPVTFDACDLVELS